MRSTLSPGSGCVVPRATLNARSAASGLLKTNVEERNTAGLAEPTDSRGSKPRVRTAVGGRTTYGIARLFVIRPPCPIIERARLPPLPAGGYNGALVRL